MMTERDTLARMAVNTNPDKTTPIFDSGGTSHAIGESAAQALQGFVTIRPVRTNIQLNENGKILESKGRADIRQLTNTLVVGDGFLVDNIASVPQFDLEGRYILFGGQKARIGVLDETVSLQVHAEAVLGGDRSYRFSGSDLMALPDVWIMCIMSLAIIGSELVVRLLYRES